MVTILNPVQPFSWKRIKERAVKHAIQTNKTMAKANNNPDFKGAHPDWCRDAATGNYTVLTTKTREEILKVQDRHLKRRLKLIGQ